MPAGHNGTGILKTLSTLEALRKFDAVDMDMGFSLEHVQMIEVFLEHTFVIKLSGGGRWRSWIKDEKQDFMALF